MIAAVKQPEQTTQLLITELRNADPTRRISAILRSVRSDHCGHPRHLCHEKNRKYSTTISTSTGQFDFGAIGIQLLVDVSK